MVRSLQSRMPKRERKNQMIRFNKGISNREYDKFKEFFTEYGVVFEERDVQDLPKDIEFDYFNGKIVLSVAQAHFHFDSENGEYIGVLWDEMGRFDKRI